MNNQDLVKKIVQKLGGKENIAAASNCMTRLRVDLKDYSQVDIKELKAVEGVMGVVEDETLQIVVGPGKAKKCLDILKSDYNISSNQEVGEEWEKKQEDIKEGRKQKKLKKN